MVLQKKKDFITGKNMKKNYTFSLETEFIKKAKQAIENDSLLTYSSFNHFVEVALRNEYQIALKKQKRAGKN
jgi:hypothetical protein